MQGVNGAPSPPSVSLDVGGAARTSDVMKGSRTSAEPLAKRQTSVSVTMGISVRRMSMASRLLIEGVTRAVNWRPFACTCLGTGERSIPGVERDLDVVCQADGQVDDQDGDGDVHGEDDGLAPAVERLTAGDEDEVAAATHDVAQGDVLPVGLLVVAVEDRLPGGLGLGAPRDPVEEGWGAVGGG